MELVSQVRAVAVLSVPCWLSGRRLFGWMGNELRCPVVVARPG